MRFFGRTRTPWEGDFPLTRRRIYVLPSRMGLIFAGALLVMLVLTINYGLALGYVLVFVLGGVFWVSLFHAWRNLAGLVLRPGRGDPVHAGETAELNLSFLNPTRLARYAIRLDTGRDTEAQEVDIAAEAEQMVSVALKTEKRGWQPAPLLRLTSDFPLGLWRVWTLWYPAAGVLAWPAPENPPSPLPQSHDPTGHAEQHQHGGDDFSHLRPYRPGDSIRRQALRMAGHGVARHGPPSAGPAADPGILRRWRRRRAGVRLGAASAGSGRRSSPVAADKLDRTGRTGRATLCAEAATPPLHHRPGPQAARRLPGSPGPLR